MCIGAITCCAKPQGGRASLTNRVTAHGYALSTRLHPMSSVVLARPWGIVALHGQPAAGAKAPCGGLPLRGQPLAARGCLHRRRARARREHAVRALLMLQRDEQLPPRAPLVGTTAGLVFLNLFSLLVRHHSRAGINALWRSVPLPSCARLNSKGI